MTNTCYFHDNYFDTCVQTKMRKISTYVLWCMDVVLAVSAAAFSAIARSAAKDAATLRTGRDVQLSGQEGGGTNSTAWLSLCSLPIE